MKITRLEVESFKRITAAAISPNGAVVTVAGKNRAGKSSVLDAIEAALGGGKHSPAEPIHRGDKSARVVVETDEITVTRKWNGKGSQLEVRAKDGAIFPSPQAMLDKLVGPLSFDPVAFCKLDAKEQAATLRKLVGLDFAAEDGKRQGAYDKRTEHGREAKRIQGALDKLPEAPKSTPDTEVSVAELTKEIERRQGINAGHAESRRELADLRKQATEAQADIERLEAELERVRARFAQISESGKALSVKVSALVDEDLNEVRAKIATAETTNRAVRAKADRIKLEYELAQEIDECERLTKYIAEIDEVKKDATEKAIYPIAGLSVTDDGVQYNGVPLEQASGAEKIAIGAAIGLALNPELRVLLVRDASLIDKDSMRALADIVEKADAQVWLEVVSEDGKGCTVLIEDGQVSAE